MADQDSPLSQPESNNFENDFEKLDPFAPSGANPDEIVSSSSVQSPEEAEEDLYSASPVSEPEPLISLGGEATGPTTAGVGSVQQQEPEPLLPSAVQPDSSSSLPEALAAAASEPLPVSPPPAARPEPPVPEPVQPVTKPSAPPAQPQAPVQAPVQAQASPAPAPAAASGGCTASVSFMKNIDPRVLDLIYWRDVKKTGVVFGSMMVLLLSLAMFSVLSVVAYLSLAALTVTISFRVYKNVLQAVQKTGEGHPFKQYLDVDIAIPSDKVHQAADHIVQHASCTLRELRHLFLVEDLIDSIKFALLLWVLTYIGAWFNGMTLIILATVTVFTLPKVYETHKTQIDQYLDLARAQIRNVMKQIQEKIPLPGKKKTA